MPPIHLKHGPEQTGTGVKPMSGENFVPALRNQRYDRFYDAVVALTTREKAFRRTLADQVGVRPGDRVLDLACGTGTFAIMLKRQFPDVVINGLDADAYMLEIARAKADKAGLAIEFEQAMSYEMPYEDGRFDRVASSLFFHHLTPENKLRTLREVERVLVPNGEVHIADWGLASNRLMERMSVLVQKFDGYETTADSFAGALPQLMYQAGFENISETRYLNTVFGTIRFHSASKPQ